MIIQVLVHSRHVYVTTQRKILCYLNLPFLVPLLCFRLNITILFYLLFYFTSMTVLKWSDMLAKYAMWVMVTYLTDVWELSITKSAGIINLWTGTENLMQIVFAFLSDEFMGKYFMLLLSSIAYSIVSTFLKYCLVHYNFSSFFLLWANNQEVIKCKMMFKHFDLHHMFKTSFCVLTFMYQ